MTTYICKCGRTFQKNTGAGTTGFRMPDYGPEHECYGCPFVQKEYWRENGQDVDVSTCRGSKVLDYQTDAYCCDTKGATLHVRTLDLEFIQAFFKDYLTLPGHTYDHLYHGMDSPENGRWQYGFGFAANKQGDADRKALTDRYFRSEGERPGELPSGCNRLVRRDVTPEQEKENVLNQIKEAKAVTQGKAEPAEVGTKYYHHCLVYFAGKREDNGKYTVFLDDAKNPGPDTLTEVATVPDFDTFAEAQNALDGLALKQEFSRERPTDVKTSEMEQQEYYSLSADPDGGPVVSLSNDADQNDTSADQSGLSADENPPSDNDIGDSENDDAEQPPQSCDWKNASGGDEKEDEGEDETDKPDQSLPDGPDLSLRLPAFDAIFNAADDALRDMARTLKTKFIESGELDLKIVIDNMGGILRPNCKSSKGYCQLKPAKVTFPIRFSSDVEFTVDAQGRVILPEDREHQINFDEIQPGQREYPAPGGTATIDGKTGIVEGYMEDGEEPEDPPTSDDVTNSVVGDDSDPDEKPDELYPCDNYDCPFYAPPDSGNCGCGFDGKVYPSNVSEAVETYGCTRPEVLEAYGEDHPVENESEENEE